MSSVSRSDNVQHSDNLQKALGDKYTVQSNYSGHNFVVISKDNEKILSHNEVVKALAGRIKELGKLATNESLQSLGQATEFHKALTEGRVSIKQESAEDNSRPTNPSLSRKSLFQSVRSLFSSIRSSSTSKSEKSSQPEKATKKAKSQKTAPSPEISEEALARIISPSNAKSAFKDIAGKEMQKAFGKEGSTKMEFARELQGKLWDRIELRAKISPGEIGAWTSHLDQNQASGQSVLKELTEMTDPSKSDILKGLMAHVSKENQDVYVRALNAASKGQSELVNATPSPNWNDKKSMAENKIFQEVQLAVFGRPPQEGIGTERAALLHDALDPKKNLDAANVVAQVEEKYVEARLAQLSA